MVSLRVRVARYGKGSKPMPTPCHWWQADEPDRPHRRLFWCRELLLRDVTVILNGTDGWALGTVVGVRGVQRKVLREDVGLPDLGDLDVEGWLPFVWDRVEKVFRVEGRVVGSVEDLLLTPDRVLCRGARPD